MPRDGEPGFSDPPPEGVAYIYCLTNPHYQPVKIGSTDRAVAERARELSATTGVPGQFRAAGIWYVPKDMRLEVERAIHVRCKKARADPRREFFSLTPDEARQAIEDAFRDLGLTGFLEGHRSAAAAEAERIQRISRGMTRARELQKEDARSRGAQAQADRERRLAWAAEQERRQHAHREAVDAARRTARGDSWGVALVAGGIGGLFAGALADSAWIALFVAWACFMGVLNWIADRAASKVPALSPTPDLPEDAPEPSAIRFAACHRCGAVMRLRQPLLQCVDGACPACGTACRLGAGEYLTRPAE